MSRNLRISTVRLICLGGFYLLLLLIYATAAQAQTSKTLDLKSGTQQVEILAARLQLNEEQRVAIRPIMKEFMTSTRAVLEKHGVDPQSGEQPSLTVLFALRGDMQKYRKQMEEQLYSVLSPEQMSTFRQFQDEQREARRARLKQSN
ncbi:MAG: hypothetical protein GY933_01960 [Hyphomicrobiales bacterium]|nr:hypothetical protein [Hyphomicrobiales bacterium]